MTEYESIKKTCHVLITGQHHSGKTAILTKLYENAEAIWKLQVKPYNWTGRSDLVQNKPVMQPGETWEWPEAVWIGGTDPMCRWVDHEGIADWWDSKNPDQPYKKLKAHRRPDALVQYLKETRAVLFIDDAHKLTGRKLVVAKACFTHAFRAIISCSSENQIPPSLRLPVLASKPQVVHLTSEAAYDATHLLIWVFVTFLFFAGMTEVAFALGAFEAFKGGRNAGKQN